MQSAWFESLDAARGVLVLGVALIFGFMQFCLADSAAPIVHANGEQLEGQWTGEGLQIAAFRGVPFAASPVGKLRWRQPVPHSPRPGIQPANQFAAACMQGTGGVDWYVGVARAFGHGPEVVGRPRAVSENCLYLNIWSPSLSEDAKLPVMVYVHGGSNSGGWSYEPNYLGASLARRGVVVVTVSYRLGPFGFFSHSSLENEGEATANFALLDIRAAFEWVNENISEFGGNPENITAFGESAGALDILDLLLSDVSAGRAGHSHFSRLISQSIGGSLQDRQTLDEERAVAATLVGSLGIQDDASASDLRKISATDLLSASNDLAADYYPDAVIDGVLMQAQPVEVLSSRDFSGVEILAGTNADEWLMYLDADKSRQDLLDWIDENAAGQRQTLLAMFAEDMDIRRSLDRLRTARSMLCPTRYLAQKVNAAGGRAWVYYFSRQRSGPGGKELGAYHGTEIPYVFDSHDDWLPTDDVDRSLTEVVLDYWVQFARTGDPNLDGRPGWPPHSGEQAPVMELGESIGLMEPFYEDLCEMLGPVEK